MVSWQFGSNGHMHTRVHYQDRHPDFVPPAQEQGAEVGGLQGDAGGQMPIAWLQGGPVAAAALAGAGGGGSAGGRRAGVSVVAAFFVSFLF